MERPLKLWIQNQCQKNVPVSLLINQNKAMSVYDEQKKSLSKSAVNAPEFHASNSWFNRFKNTKAKLYNITSTGESASADKQDASEFVERLAKIVGGGVTLLITFLMLTRHGYSGIKCLYGPIW
jgi:hypothetical protein